MPKSKISLAAFSCSSPDDLKRILAQTPVRSAQGWPYVSLAVADPQFLVCPFDIPDVAESELEPRLKADAVELLSLPLGDVDLDFQVLVKSDRRFAGILVCAPKTIVQDYLRVVSEHGGVLIRITALALLRINGLLTKLHSQGERFCILDFRQKDLLTLSVFREKHCEMIRKIPFTDIAEVQQEIFQTLRAVCSRSHVKRFDHIYVAGDLPQQEEVLKDIKEVFAVKLECVSWADVDAPLGLNDNYFHLNLAKNYAVSLPAREVSLRFLNILIALMSVLLLFLSFAVIRQDHQIRKIRGKFRDADYQKALELQKQIHEAR